MLLTQGLLAPGRSNRTGDRRRPTCALARFYALTQTLVPRLVAASLLACALGLYLGFFSAPPDIPQGETYRIALLHLPATWISALLFLVLALCAGLGLVYNARLAHMAVQALAPTGALFAFLALWSDALWDKPVSGAWLLWDMRLVSELTLLALYVALVALRELVDSAPRADKATAALALAGGACLLVFAFATQGWADAHQGRWMSLTLVSGGSSQMQLATLMIAVSFLFYAGAVVLLRLRCVILELERNSDWVQACLAEYPCHE